MKISSSNITKTAATYWVKETKKKNGFLNITQLDFHKHTYLVMSYYTAFVLNEYEYHNFLQESLHCTLPAYKDVIAFGGFRDQISLIDGWINEVMKNEGKEVYQVGLFIPLTGAYETTECEAFYCPSSDSVICIDRLFTNMVNWNNVEKITSAGTFISPIVIHFKNGQKALLGTHNFPKNSETLSNIDEALEMYKNKIIKSEYIKMKNNIYSATIGLYNKGKHIKDFTTLTGGATIQEAINNLNLQHDLNGIYESLLHLESTDESTLET